MRKQYCPNPFELVLYLSDPRFLNEERQRELVHRFEFVTIAAPVDRPGTLPESVRWLTYDAHHTRSDVWNRLLKESRTEWVLFLVDDEQLHIPDLASLTELSENRWIPARILWPDGRGGLKSVYQMRLVRAEGEFAENPLFDGRELPDCSRTLLQAGVEISTRVLHIFSPGQPFGKVQNEAELQGAITAPQAYLLQAGRYFRQKKYVHAMAYYRTVAKREKLFPFERLAAVNGMMQCYTEQYKWEEALVIARQSVEAEPRQRIPWLVLYRIFQLRQQWEEAYQALESYHAMLEHDSRASFDQMISEEQSLEWLARVAVRSGNRESALAALERLLMIRKSGESVWEEGNHPADLLIGRRQIALSRGGSGEDTTLELRRQLLHLAIELKEEGKAIEHFASVQKTLPEEEFHLVMTCFMENGWYEPVTQAYNQLFQSDPDHPEYRRRLIASLAKQGHLKQARELVARSVG